MEEPEISVGLMAMERTLPFHLLGNYKAEGGRWVSPGEYVAQWNGKEISILSGADRPILAGAAIVLNPESPVESCFVLREVPVGAGFHWEHRQDQTFRGGLHLQVSEGKIVVTNRILLESYLSSVIGSEMSRKCPLESLKAHAVIARNWALARMKRKGNEPTGSSLNDHRERVIRWTGAEIHRGFDVCADDHCQRYRGTEGIVSRDTRRAVRETRGEVLTDGAGICDTRYSKCCGGMTEDFRSAWEDRDIPYLKPVVDNDSPPRGYSFPLSEEARAEAWITGSPEAYCNTQDREALKTLFSQSDQKTLDFFRWQVEYSQEELASIIHEKIGVDLGRIHDLVPVQRGASARLVHLRIVGTRKSLTIGKELEIRRVLSPTHLYSSAFVVRTERGQDGVPTRFHFIGAGWGHGVGLCQVGAAIMATRGKTYREILHHYFPARVVKKIYF